MKQTALALMVSLILSGSLQAALPAEAIQEFNNVHGLIALCAAGRGVELDAGKVEKYWAALQSLGKKELSVSDSDLNALDRRIVQMAQDHARQPEKAKAIVGWYGGYSLGVPRELRDPEGKMSDEDWERFVNPPIMRRPQALKKEQLQSRHLTPEYRITWEAWLLAPRTTEQKMQLTQYSLDALTACASVESIPALKEFLKNHTAESAVKSYDPSEYLYGGSAYGHLMSVFRNINTPASLDAMMDVVESASSVDSAIGNMKRKDYDLTSLSIRQWNEQIFTWIMSGYFGKHVNYSLSDYPPLRHNLGRTYLPAIEALLKKEDLAPWRKELLNRTREAILKHAPALPK